MVDLGGGWGFRGSGVVMARLVAGCGPSLPLVGRVAGPFVWSGLVWLLSGWVTQRADLLPGQDEIGLVGVSVG
jgi:hypothetical protein